MRRVARRVAHVVAHRYVRFLALHVYLEVPIPLFPINLIPLFPGSCILPRNHTVNCLEPQGFDLQARLGDFYVRLASIGRQDRANCYRMFPFLWLHEALLCFVPLHCNHTQLQSRAAALMVGNSAI